MPEADRVLEGAEQVCVHSSALLRVRRTTALHHYEPLYNLYDNKANCLTSLNGSELFSRGTTLTLCDERSQLRYSLKKTGSLSSNFQKRRKAAGPGTSIKAIDHRSRSGSQTLNLNPKGVTITSLSRSHFTRCHFYPSAWLLKGAWHHLHNISDKHNDNYLH